MTTSPKTTTVAKPETPMLDDGTTTGALVPVAAGGDVVSFDANEWGDVGDGDLAPPSEVLLPLLPMNRKLGEGVLDPQTGDVTDELEFIWLARTVTRAWWDKKFDERDEKDPAPKCRSTDGLVGIGHFGPGSAENPSGKCATCPAAQWTPPEGILPCRSAIEAMVATPDSAQGGAALFRLRFSGIAFAPARAYWDSFRARLPKIPPIGFLTHMALAPTETKNGKFLAPTFTRVRQLERTAIQPLIDERDRLIDDFRRIVAEETETRTADVDEQDHRQGGPFDDPAEAAGVEKVKAAFGGNDGPANDEEPF
jgi:hypothetical protein